MRSVSGAAFSFMFCGHWRRINCISQVKRSIASTGGASHAAASSWCPVTQGIQNSCWIPGVRVADLGIPEKYLQHRYGQLKQISDWMITCLQPYSIWEFDGNHIKSIMSNGALSIGLLGFVVFSNQPASALRCTWVFGQEGTLGLLTHITHNELTVGLVNGCKRYILQ